MAKRSPAAVRSRAADELSAGPGAPGAGPADAVAIERTEGVPSTLPPRSGGEGRFAPRQQGEPGWGEDAGIERTAGADALAPPTPDPSPPLAALAGGGETDAPGTPTRTASPSDLPLSGGGEEEVRTALAGGGETTGASAPDIPSAGPDDDRLAAPATGARKRRSPRKFEIGDELKADWKRRYETTDESVVDIAAGSGFEETLVRRTAKKEGWVRYKRPPLGLSPAAKLATQAERLAGFASRRDEDGASSTLPPGSGGEAGREAPVEIEKTEAAARASPPTPDPPSLRFGGQDPSPPLASLMGGGEKDAAVAFDGDIKAAARELIAAIRAQIAEIEALRAGLKTTGRRPTQASRAAHDLAMLSGAVQRLQPISNGARAQVDDDDDVYEDVDELRRRVAAKIQAFLDRRPDIGVAPGSGADGAEEDRA